MCTSSINYKSKKLFMETPEDVIWARKKLDELGVAVVCTTGITHNLFLASYPDKTLIDYTGRFKNEEQLSSYMRRHWEETLKEILKALENG